MTPVELGDEPESLSEADIENGKKIYAIAQCAKCHGELGYGDGNTARGHQDSGTGPPPPRQGAE